MTHEIRTSKNERYFQRYRAESGSGGYLGKGCLFLVDRPGSLAELASLFAKYNINIIFFHYNRSEHPNRVLLEVRSETQDALERVHQELSGRAISLSVRIIFAQKCRR